MHHESIQQFKKHLGQLDKWLEAAVAYADTKKFSPDVYAALRLAPDQLPFSFQVQAACDSAKLACTRLTGKEAPVFADTEKTVEELRARVRATIAYIDTLTAKDFEGAATRSITTPRWEGKTMTGASYFLQHAQPNFYFHLTTAYAILRHNGVSLGKKDYLGALSFDPS
jgi:hypothetical protein